MSLKRNIKQQRTDVSKYLFHWTTRDGFEGILRSGFFIAAFAPRKISPDEEFNTIRGNNPAVCFSEMPIGNYLQSTTADSHRYPKWGISILRDTLYAYGARPVLYGDEHVYTLLKRPQPASEGDRYRFLFSNYSPLTGNSDWMHEREWRVRPNIGINDCIGLGSNSTIKHSSNGTETKIKCNHLVPLHLPRFDARGNQQSRFIQDPQFILLVETERDKARITAISQQGEIPPVRAFWKLGDYSSISDYREKYLAALKKASVISFEYIKKEHERSGLWRLEDFI